MPFLLQEVCFDFSSRSNNRTRARMESNLADLARRSLCHRLGSPSIKGPSFLIVLSADAPSDPYTFECHFPSE